MVTIVNYKERQREDGTSFHVLEIQGGIDLVMSQTTGQFYATSKRAYLSSTFNAQACEALLGTKIPGEIEKQPCEPYPYLVKETGETMILSHRWIYVPEVVADLQQQQSNKEALYMSVDSFQKTPAFEHQYTN
ncbi:MAG: hypothetical protein PHR83_13920 [Paludibacter sp.]|nr:hypothetical protein [Paludibacter sp.]